jgi:chromosome segregation ATPase
MMDSMHAVVDGLSSLQEEIACLNDQQKSLAANVEASCGNIDLTPILKPIETLTSSLDSFKTELAEVKKTQAEILDKIQQQAPPTPATNSTAQIETLIQAQNATMDKLLKEMAALRKEQQQQRTATPQSATPFLQHPQPQNIRQALAFAEQDLRRHLTTLQALYHRGGVSRALTERTAEFMALLGSSVKAAQAGRTEV